MESVRLKQLEHRIDSLNEKLEMVFKFVCEMYDAEQENLLITISSQELNSDVHCIPEFNCKVAS